MINLKDIKEANERIKKYINKTNVVYSEGISTKYGGNVYFKPENLQHTGAFKLRGVMNTILSLTEEERSKGVITASSGNNALAVSYAAKLLGLDATVVMPVDAPKMKSDGVKALGGTIVEFGMTQPERYEKVAEIIEEKGCALVHSCLDDRVIAGHGTLGLELLEELETMDTVVIPLGAGALAVGMACAIKEIKPSVRVITVEAKAIDRFTQSYKAGHPIDVPFKNTAADGLTMTKTYDIFYDMMVKYVDDVIAVEENSILDATKEIICNAKLLVEPSAAIGLAAVLEGSIDLSTTGNTVFLLTGGNMDVERIVEIISR